MVVQPLGDALDQLGFLPGNRQAFALKKVLPKTKMKMKQYDVE